MQYNPISSVRKSQRAWLRELTAFDVGNLLDLKTVDQVTNILTEKYFPLSVRNGNDMAIYQVKKLYKTALFLFPLQYRLRGTYLPDWDAATILSWIRRCANMRTKMTWYCCYELPDVAPLDAIKKCQANAVEAGIFDAKWARENFAFAIAAGRHHTRKSALARLIYEPWLYADYDRKMQRLIEYSAIPGQRRKRRAQGLSVASYLRIGRQVILLGDKRLAKTFIPPGAEAEWRNIETHPMIWGDYRIQYVAEHKACNVTVSDSASYALLGGVREVLNSKAKQGAKAAQIRRLTDAWFHEHRHAPGSLHQFQLLDRKIARMVRRKLQAGDKDVVYKIRCREVRSQLTYSIQAPFSMVENARLSEATWLSFWSPFR